MDAEFVARASAHLHRAVGSMATFHDQQLEAIHAVAVERRPLLVVQRTGWGKSIVYFIATRLLRDEGAGPTIIVSPLLALMRDQLEAARRIGLVAATINSSNNSEWDAIEADLLTGQVDVLLISPERLNNPIFRDRLLTPLASAAGLLVIDEAHCISDWGHDFRPDYRRIVRVLGLLPSGVPVLCATATANDRVIGDIVAQLGDDLRVLRGPLDRESLSLSVLKVDSQAERLVWLLDWVAARPGTGIVYCLTIADTQRVADWLARNGIPALAYSGDSDPGHRLEVEEKLKSNEVKVVAATSALGMGFDKPDLAFVVHFQSPDSPVAYYQQVGRAGRAIEQAEAVLLVGGEDQDIWDYFLNASIPVQWHAEQVVDLLAASMEWVHQNDIEMQVNIARSRLVGLLKLLEVDGAVERDGYRFRRTLAPWSYDAGRFERVRAARLAEQETMRRYADAQTCRMRFLRETLNDPVSADCGRCDVCRGTTPEVSLDPAKVVAAVEFIRRRPVSIEPRKQWSKPRSGRIHPEHQLQPGRALSYLNDPGWGRDLMTAKHAGAHVSQDMVEAAARLIRDWLREFSGSIVAVPNFEPARDLVTEFAGRLAELLRVPVSQCVHKMRHTQPQKLMLNSAQQLRNVLGAYEVRGPVPSGPVLLVDDVSDSRWTMTVIGELLAQAGAGPVYPFTIAKARG